MLLLVVGMGVGCFGIYLCYFTVRTRGLIAWLLGVGLITIGWVVGVYGGIGLLVVLSRPDVSAFSFFSSSHIVYWAV